MADEKRTTYQIPLPSGMIAEIEIPNLLTVDDIEAMYEQLTIYKSLFVAQSKVMSPKPRPPSRTGDTLVGIPRSPVRLASPSLLEPPTPAPPPPLTLSDRILELLLDGGLPLNVDHLRKLAGPLAKSDEAVKQEADKLVADGYIYLTEPDTYSATEPGSEYVPYSIPEDGEEPEPGPKNDNKWPVAILIGGPANIYRNLRKKASVLNIELRYHLDTDRTKHNTTISKDVDLAIAMTEFGNIDHALEVAKAQGVPIVKSAHKWSILSRNIQEQWLDKRKVG